MATEKELAQALAPAFGMYPKAFRGNYGNPQDAANLPVDVTRGRTASFLGFGSDLLNMFQSPKPMEVFGDVQYEPKIKVPYDTEHFLKTLPLAPTSRAVKIPNLAGSFVPLNPAPAVKAGVAAAKALGPTAANMAEQYMVKTGGILPLDVYHGTPYTLPPTARNPLGEFDASKIGTGEGAQAYGFGIYTAENPAVAKGYADKLATTGRSGPWWEDMVRQRIAKGESIDDAKKFVAQNNPSLAEKIVAIPDKVLAVNKSFYKVDLPDEMIPKMLDWDKPLSQQSPQIRAALAPIIESTAKSFPEIRKADPTGQQLYKSYVNHRGNNADYASEGLRQAGIPGIKYLDEGSRAEGKGTRNFVTFPGEEKNLTILERNAEKSVK